MKYGIFKVVEFNVTFLVNKETCQPGTENTNGK